jgi:hypothetical protein
MAAAVITAALTGTAGVADARIQDEDQQLTRMAAVAESASQHERVGELYLARAQRLEREATRLERTSRRLERNRFPHEYKAPAPQVPGYRERQRAAEARQIARESRLLAEHHDRLAQELYAEP